MIRLAILLLVISALPAHALDLEKWADDMVKKEQAGWRNERMGKIQKDRDPKERAEAARSMSTSDPEELALLANALSDSDARVRQAAASRLWDAEKNAQPYRPQLTKALDDPDANVVAYAAGALQSSGVKEAELAPARKRVIAAPDASVNARFYAARNLVGYESPRKILDPMLAYLERNTREYTGSVSDKSSKNVELAQKALEHLVKQTQDRSLIQPLFEALVETKNAQIPLMRTLGLYEPKPEGWTHSMLRQLDNPNPHVRYAALGQLRSMTKEKDVAAWAPRVGQMLQDPDSSVRSEALWALGAAAGLATEEVEHVAAALGDPEKSVRRSAARALGEIAESSQALPAATKSRAAAAARPALTTALQDSDSDVRDEAKSALGKIGTGAGGGTAVASASPTARALSSPTARPSAQAAASADAEAAGMAVLRKRKVSFEETSYFRALQEVDPELVRAFLDAGMSPTKSLFELGPPIRAMLFSSNACAPNVRPTKAETKDIVKLLLERGADVNGADANGNTAITEAASKGCDRELIRILIKAGAKINATNQSGLTPFEMGLYSGHDGLEELIAAGYRLPPAKAKMYLEGYKDRPAAIAMIRKASGKN